MSNNFADKNSEYGKKHIQSAVLREWQQGEKRYCPHHGTSDNQRTVAQFSCKRSIPKDLWDVKGNKAKGKSVEARDINHALDNIKAQIIKHYQRISDREAFVTAEMVRNAYQGIGSEYETLLKAFDRENEVFKKRVGKDRTIATYRSRVVARNHVAAFIKSFYRRTDMSMLEIIAFNRIDNNGNTISDRHERLRSTRICKELTLKYGLHMAGGKDNVKRNRLKEPDRTKYALYDIIKMEVGRCGNWNVLIANLKRQGVEVHFKHKGQTSEVQGVVFSMNGYHFNGSKVDRRFSYSKIDAALQHNRCRERMGITAGIYETATPSAPSGTAQSELFNGSWGLLKSSGSSYNAADAEANLEMAEILRRKKKRKKGLRL